METQTDPENVDTLPVSPVGSDTFWHFGAYLDFNSNTPRYPQTPVGNGPFPAAQCVSIRGQHQCNLAEIFYPGDPTEPNANPNSSDNLAQRNLAIIETDNPGREATHTVQHSFDLVLPGRREQARMNHKARRDQFQERERKIAAVGSGDSKAQREAAQASSFYIALASTALTVSQSPWRSAAWAKCSSCGTCRLAAQQNSTYRRSTLDTLSWSAPSSSRHLARCGSRTTTHWQSIPSA